MGYLLNSLIHGEKKAKQIEKNKQHKELITIKEEKLRQKEIDLKLKEKQRKDKLVQKEDQKKLKIKELQLKEKIREEKREKKEYKNVKPDLFDTLDNKAKIKLVYVDELFEASASLFVSADSASLNMLQRRFNINSDRAEIIMNQLERAGIVETLIEIGKPRNVIIKTHEELDDIISSFT